MRLNVLAVVAALLGLANTALAWKIFGATESADVWMMTIVIASGFSLLSQLGVEQVAVYSAEAHARSTIHGMQFDTQSLIWAVLFGVGFAAVGMAMQGFVVTAFASGFPAAKLVALKSVMLPMWSLVAIWPSQFVVIQLWLIKGRVMRAMLLNIALPATQCIVLVLVLASGQRDARELAMQMAVGIAAVGVLTVILGMRDARMAHLRRPAALLPFIKASLQLRAAHSIHNFLVLWLTNAALSTLSAGAVASFQYMKRVADGLAAVSVGPHQSVFHARQAVAWSRADRLQFALNVRNYVATALPLFIVAGLLFSLAAGGVLKWFGDGAFYALRDEGILLWVFIAWNALIALETVSVGVLVVCRQPAQLLAVNATYASCLYLALTFATPYITSGVSVALLAAACQLLSFMLFCILALRLYRRKFPV
jgi:hypothetical protein